MTQNIKKSFNKRVMEKVVQTQNAHLWTIILHILGYTTPPPDFYTYFLDTLYIIYKKTIKYLTSKII